MLHNLAHAIPDWLLVPLAGIGVLCILCTAALALAVAGLQRVARQREDREDRGRAGLEALPSRARIVDQPQRAGEDASEPTTLRNPERVAPS